MLLVDDEESVLALGRALLKRCGYKVLVAQDGVEALEVYERHRPDIALVILDMMMPRMHGRVCLRRLLEIDSQVRVLVATGYAVDDTVRALLQEGALAAVEKPYGLRELSIAVREALDADLVEHEPAPAVD